MCDDPDISVPPTGTPVFVPAASCPVGRLDHAGPLRVLPLSPCSPLNKVLRARSCLVCTARTTNTEHHNMARSVGRTYAPKGNLISNQIAKILAYRMLSADLTKDKRFRNHEPK